MDKTEELTLEEKLAEIARRMDEAKGDPKKELAVLESDIVDPQDSLNCEGCQ